jgi:signal transduction histidine kinase
VKKILSFLFFSVVLISCKKESATTQFRTDSLSVYMERAQKSTNRSQQLISNEKAAEILKEAKNDSLTREKLFQVSLNYFTMDEYQRFKKINNVILKKVIEAGDTVSIAKIYRYDAEYYKHENKSDSALIVLIKAEKLLAKINDTENLGKILFKKGSLQYDKGDLLGADLSMSHAYTLLKNSQDKQLLYQVLSMTGIIANALEDYSKAIEYHNKALVLVKESSLDPTLNQETSTLNNLGGVYQRLNNNKEAIRNFNKALANKEQLKSAPDLYALLLDNLAYSKLKLKDQKELPALFYRSLKIRDSLDLKSFVILSKIHLSEYYAEHRDTIKSQQLSKEALMDAHITKSPIDMLLSLKQLSLIDHKNSPIYSKKYIQINDSLQQTERKSRDKFARIQLETKEILEENDKLAAQNRSLLYFFVGTLMIGVLLFVIRAQRSKNRELLLKQAQQKANEDIYNLMISQQNKIEESRIREKKRIAQELHDGVLGRLFGARLNLDSLNRTSSDDAIKKRNDYLSELKNIEQDIREISHDLNREKYVLINNFIAILNNLLEEQRASFNMELNVTVDDAIQWELLGNTAKINLYRIIQESLQNINKYAGATKVQVSIKKADDNIVLSVTDNGNGFAVSTKKKGIGLQNMISRTHELNGIFDIRSKKGAGTSVIVTFPIETKQTIIA